MGAWIGGVNGNSHRVCMLHVDGEQANIAVEIL
jgi:hypothetical protein